MTRINSRFTAAFMGLIAAASLAGCGAHAVTAPAADVTSASVQEIDAPASETTTAAETSESTSGEAQSEDAPAAETTTASAEAETQGSEAEEAENTVDKGSSKEYMDALTEKYRAYSAAYLAYSNALQDMDFEAARTAIDNADDALTELEKVSAPPAFAEHHKKLVDSAAQEHEMLSVNKEFTYYLDKAGEFTGKESMTEEEEKEANEFFEEYTQMLGKVQEVTSSSEFVDVYVETCMAVTDKINGE